MRSSLLLIEGGRLKMIQPTDKYQVTWPKNTHFRRATCQEVDCDQFLKGWVTIKIQIDSTEDCYIRNDKTRKSVGVRMEDNTMSYFFEAGQPCFRSHRATSKKPPLLTVNQPGRESARLIRANMDFDEWTDRFNEQSYRSTRRNR